MEVEKWKRNFSFRLKDGDETISRFIISSKKSESDTIRELLRFAVNEIYKTKNERLLVENLKQLEAKLTEMIQQQEENHREVIKLLKNGVVLEHSPNQKDTIEDEKSSMDSSIDSLLDMFNGDF